MAVTRTGLSIVSIALLLAFASDLVKQIKNERFSTRDFTESDPFDNRTKFGMVEMPSLLVYTNILSNASFSGVSLATLYEAEENQTEFRTAVHLRARTCP